MFRLIIDNEECELNSKSIITLNKLIIDLEDLSLRGINFTNSINLPITNKNDRLTGYPSRLASNNLAFEIRKDYILFDGVSILSRGNVIVKSYDEKAGIKIQLAEGSDFWTRAGSKLLEDLILHNNDFTFTASNMNALKAKTSSVFVTALHSATGSATDTALVNYNFTRPCYNWKIVLDKIISELGYTVDYTNILEKTDLLNLGCLSNSEKFFVSDFKRRFQNINQLGNIDYTNSNVIYGGGGSTGQLGSTLTNATYKTSYVIKGFVNSLINTQINLQVNGNNEVLTVPAGRTFINFRTDEVEIGSTFVVNFPTTVLLQDVYIYSAINEEDIFTVSGQINIEGFNVLADYNLPQHSYKQFIKNIIKLCFLDFAIDENKKLITFKYLPGVINTNNVVDFSKKVERYYTIESGSVYGQLSVFNYNNEDDINVNRGSAFVNINNENAPEIKEILSIQEYSASLEINASGNNILLCNIYNTTENKRQAIKNRILFFEEVGPFGINATFTPVSWQRIYSKNYVKFIQATKRERVISFDAYLNNLDFRTLQRNPVIYIDFLQSNFLVTDIEGFQRNEKCKIKCIKYN